MKGQKISTNFRNFAKISMNFAKISNKIFCFCSHFLWLNKIFMKEIEQKFGNPSNTVVCP